MPPRPRLRLLAAWIAGVVAVAGLTAAADAQDREAHTDVATEGDGTSASTADDRFTPGRSPGADPDAEPTSTTGAGRTGDDGDDAADAADADPTTTTTAPTSSSTTPSPPATPAAPRSPATGPPSPVVEPQEQPSAQPEPPEPVDLDRQGLWVVDADEPSRHRLLLGGEVYPLDWSFSGDGRQVVVITSDGAVHHGSDPVDTWIVEVATGARRRLLPPTVAIGNPSWSPDGRWIALYRTPLGDYPSEESPTAPPGPHLMSDVFLVHPDGTDFHRAVSAGGGGPGPWSPDSRYLVVPINGDDRVVIADVDAGTEVRHVLVDAFMADWSPDGRRLVVGAVDPEGSTRTVSIVDAATGAARALPVEGEWPKWSPEGDWISLHEWHVGIRLVHPDGRPGPVIDGVGFSYWSSDGTSLAYDTGFGEVTVAEIDGDTVTTRAIVEAPHRSNTGNRVSAWVPGTRLVAVLAAR